MMLLRADSFVKHANNNLGWKVTSVSLTLPNLEKRISNVQYVVGDITNRSMFKTELNSTSFEYVVNCGGPLPSSYDELRPTLFVALGWSRAPRVGCRRLLGATLSWLSKV